MTPREAVMKAAEICESYVMDRMLAFDNGCWTCATAIRAFAATLPDSDSDDDARDAARLDYLERRWMDGVHLEVCHKGGGDHPLRNAVMAVTLYVGSKEYHSDNVRTSINAAMTAMQKERA